MQISLNTQNSQNQTGFTALKRVNGGKALNRLLGFDGFTIKEKLVTNLKENDSFQTLRNKYDVFVNIIPYTCKHAVKNENTQRLSASILFNKILHIEILAREVKKGGILKLFKKNPPKEIVTGYTAEGFETKTWSLAQYILDNFIKAKEGMEADINKFLTSTNVA